jgi:acetolactate synthase-1/2/3 large subunit
MLGMHGTWYSNMAVHYSDVLIAVGARFDDRVTGKVEAFAPEATVIHIDIDPAAISKNVRVDVPIVGDVKKVLPLLIELVKPLPTEDWVRTIGEWKEEHPLRYQAGEGIRTQQVFHALGRLTGGNAILVTDVGQHQMWGAQFFTWVHPRTQITSGGLGTMGFSLPAAMGAAFGRQDIPIVSVSGDGGFQMNAQELSTIVQHRLPLKIFVINNGFLGMVRQWQELFWRKRYSQVELANPDFVKLAEAHGCRALRATRGEEVEGAIQTALDHADGPIFVEFVVEREDNVYPMIPSNQTVEEMLDTPVATDGSAADVVVLRKGTPIASRKERHAPTPVRR